MNGRDLVEGLVVEWHEDEGWGVLRSESLQHDVWAHYSQVDQMAHWTGVEAGERVRFAWEAAIDQDGYRLRATRIHRLDAPLGPSGGEADIDGPGEAYESRLTITWTDQVD